nr:MAG TPA: hypothetical protein [Caudoviricetes sp.]
MFRLIVLQLPLKIIVVVLPFLTITHYLSAMEKMRQYKSRQRALY